ncbi:tetratricopeptide repeat protein [Streptomyces avermitilis]
MATAALPAVPAGFTGRDEDLARLLPVLDPSAESDLPVVICAVSGLGGVGKTSLALYAAHRAVREGWFPGGTMFVDFRGYDDDPVTADQALLALLDGLGVRGPDLPQTPPAQYSLYRTLLAERHDPILLLLDNASDPAQLTPLVPGTDRHRVLITSRGRLTELPARLIDLDILRPEAAADLMDKSLRLSDDRDDRATHEPAAVAELTALCGHHPLALQIAVGMLRKRRYRSIGSLADELRDTADRTDALGLRPILDSAYGQLPEDQARLLRLLSLAPTAEVGTDAVAALAGLAAGQAPALLEALASSHLVTPVPKGGSLRWRLHDLVRAYGAGVAASSPDLVTEGEAARGRMLKFYRWWAQDADAALRKKSERPGPEHFTDRAEALAWLDVERAGLVASVRWSKDDLYADDAVRLTLHLMEYNLNWRRDCAEWLAISRPACAAAHRIGDRVAEARILNSLGFALRELGQTAEAMDAHAHARTLYRTTDDPHGEASAWNNIGLTLGDLGRVDEAIDALVHARDLHHASGHRNGEAAAFLNLGTALRDAGRSTEAIDAYSRARDLHHAVDDPAGEAMTWSCLGSALWEVGRSDEAVQAHTTALRMFREFGDWESAGWQLVALARMREAANDPAEARAHYLRAADVFTQGNAPVEAAQVRAAADALT